jgi:hypothetical protein
VCVCGEQRAAEKVSERREKKRRGKKSSTFSARIGTDLDVDV